MSFATQRPLTIALLSSALLAACTAGTVNGGPNGGPGETPGAHVGDGNASAGAAGMDFGAGAGGGSSQTCATQAALPVFHRLNRVEYQNSVNGLLGTKLPLQDSLPVDSLVNGFDNNADVSMSATLMEKYMTVAQSAVTAALASADARKSLIPCTLSDASCQRSVLQTFIGRAFRRPAEAAEVDKFLSYVGVCKSSLDAGISCALQAVLLSSKFLFRTELLGNGLAQACTESAPLVASPAGKLSNYAYAARLSYWLTSTAPDAELTAAAAANTLDQPTVIAAQVERLLSPEVGGKQTLPFIDNFPSQWLQLSAALGATPSKTLYPNFDDALRSAMADESSAFFKGILFDGSSALDLVRTNYTFLNERLASHYGITGVSGSAMQRVDTTGKLRGGILTQASFLTATSSSENTSIVQRAKWVLTNLLCSPLPQPPAGIADQVPPPDPALGLTNRESLTFRTGKSPCNGCHATMNPIGFGLEVFGATGEPRTTDHGKPIDPSGQLPDGQMFSDTEGLMSVLKKDPRFPVCLTKKVLIYALGRSMDAACDSRAVDQLATQWKSDNYNFKKHVVRIAQSDLFRSARTSKEVTP